MNHQYSVSEARRQFAAILRGVEAGQTVQVTRQGTHVAVLAPVDEYRRLSESGGGYWAAYQRWRASIDPADLEGDDPFADVRDRSPGRETDFS